MKTTKARPSKKPVAATPAAALPLLEQIDGGHLMFSHTAMSAEVLEDWCRGIVKDAIRDSLAAAEQKIADAVKAGKGKA